MTDKKLKMIGYSGRKKTAPASSKKLKQASLAMILGLLLMPGGILVTGAIQGLIDKELADFIRTPKPSDEGYSDFLTDDRDGAIPMYTNFYMHNLTNPEDTIAGSNPIFEEYGPYCYRVYSNKYGVSYNDDYSEVTYKSYSWYEFQPELSGAGLDPINDIITNINPGYSGVLDLASGFFSLTRTDGAEENLVRAMFPTVLQQVRDMFLDEVNGMGVELLDWLPFVPSAEEFFYFDWAMDNAPSLGNIIFDTLFRPSIKELIDGMGVDIDGMLYGITELTDTDGSPENRSGPADGFMWEPDDLSIGFLELDDSQVMTVVPPLWDDSNPLSLTGMDVMTNPIWFDYMDYGDGNPIYETANKTLYDEFGLDSNQLDTITGWIDQSIDATINPWLPNVCIKQISDWESDYITVRTVDEWLFTGVDELIYNVDPSMAKVGIFSSIESEWDSELAGASSSTFNTGQTNINDIGQYIKFNGESQITIWDPANPVNVSGTGGTQFAPGVTKDDILEIFIPQFLRPLEVEYQKDVTLKGIDMLRYVFPADTFSPDNEPYHDVFVGLANMQVSYGANVYLGQPHFYGADPLLLDDVVISSPSQELHELYIDVEPNTGATMAAKLRMAINIKVEQTDTWYKNIKEAIYPIFWLEQSAEVPDEIATMFKDLVYMVLDLKDYMHSGFVGGGAALLCIGIVTTTTQRRKTNQKRLEKFEAQKKDFHKYKHELQKYKESKMVLPPTVPKKKNLDSTK